MQQVVYKCDQCKDEIGTKKHFSLSFGPHSGVAIPPRTPGNINSDHWNIFHGFHGKFIHLCGLKCLTAWFKEQMHGKPKDRPDKVSKKKA